MAVLELQRNQKYCYASCRADIDRSSHLRVMVSVLKGTLAAALHALPVVSTRRPKSLAWQAEVPGRPGGLCGVHLGQT